MPISRSGGIVCRRACAGFGLAMWLLPLGSASATFRTWAGLGTDNDWTDANNWGPVGAPVSGDLVSCGGSITATMNETASGVFPHFIPAPTFVEAFLLDGATISAPAAADTLNANEIDMEGVTYNNFGTVNSTDTLNILDDELAGPSHFNNNGIVSTVTEMVFDSDVTDAGRTTVSGLFEPIDSNYTLTPTGTLSAAAEVIGDCSFSQTGTNTVTGNFNIYYSGGNTTYSLTAGTLSAGSESIESLFTQSGASSTNTVAGGMAVTSFGSYTLSAGTLNIAATLSIGSGNAFNFSGGTLALSTLSLADSTAQFNWSGGTLIFAPAVTIDSSFVLGQAVNLSSGETLGSATSITNNGVLTLSGGEISSPGAIANNSLIAGWGVIDGAGGFTNGGTLTQSGGDITLTNTGPNSNIGNVTLAGGYQLILPTADVSLTNSGVINLNGASVTGAGTLSNAAWGSLFGPGTIGVAFSNAENANLVAQDGVLSATSFENDGGIEITAGGTLSAVIANDGVIQLNTGGTLTGSVTNNSVIQGAGVIYAGTIDNFATIQAINGTLQFSSTSLHNELGSTLEALTADDRIALLNGTFNNEGTYYNLTMLRSSDAVTNSGTFIQDGTQVWLPGSSFTNTAGKASFLSDAGSATSSNLSVTITGGMVSLGSSQHWASLAMSGAGNLDVANHQLVIAYGDNSDPIASIAALIKSGYNGGAWNGPGIDSSIAAITPGYGIGYADSADAGNPAGLSSGTIEIKYTLLGDADLSGVADGTDFGIVAANFNKGVSGWDQGDFNYDNVVDGSDFGDLAANFNKGANGAAVGPGAGGDPALVAFAEANGLMADVPEPGGGAVVLLAAAVKLGKRRWNRGSQLF